MTVPCQLESPGRYLVTRCGKLTLQLAICLKTTPQLRPVIECPELFKNKDHVRNKTTLVLSVDDLNARVSL